VDVKALVSSPSSSISLKDGYAVCSEDVKSASRDHPVRLRLHGKAFAGAPFAGRLSRFEAVRICSGASLPDGTDAVVSEEFCREVADRHVMVQADADPGRNVLLEGKDVKRGDAVVAAGNLLRPGLIGLLAAAGADQVHVYCKPQVCAISIGDELVAPGCSLDEGQIYASNQAALCAWLSSYGIAMKTAIVKDDETAIRTELRGRLNIADVVLTSGGAWESPRDLIVDIMQEIGWREIFRSVRMGPGKGTAFGLLGDTSVFCLPGGPPSNEMAFLQLALPGILCRAGFTKPPFPTLKARLVSTLCGRGDGWRQIIHGSLSQDSAGQLLVSPSRLDSRMATMARDPCLIHLEDNQVYKPGELVAIQMLELPRYIHQV
jgi:molybdopterin molybdotransferase